MEQGCQRMNPGFLIRMDVSNSRGASIDSATSKTQKLYCIQWLLKSLYKPHPYLHLTRPSSGLPGSAGQRLCPNSGAVSGGCTATNLANPNPDPCSLWCKRANKKKKGCQKEEAGRDDRQKTNGEIMYREVMMWNYLDPVSCHVSELSCKGKKNPADCGKHHISLPKVLLLKRKCILQM